MPTESQAADARRVLTERAVQLEDIDKQTGALATDCNQQVQLIAEETEPEIDRLRALVRENRAALAAAEEQKRARIAAATKQWKEKTKVLQTKRKQIQASSVVQRSLLASVRKMPSELLVNIFEHFVRQGGRPWTLALVSVAWNKVVLSTCSVWSTIYVKIDHTSTATANSSLRRLEAHLRRAGPCTLLDIHLRFAESGGGIAEQDLKACELIGGRDMLARWRSATLINTPPNFHGRLKPLFAHPLPHLQSFSIKSRSFNNHLETFLEMIDTSAKAFRMLSVDQWAPTDLGAYPNLLKRVEVLRYVLLSTNDNRSDWSQTVYRSLSRMRALKEVELSGNTVAHNRTHDWMQGVEIATFLRLHISPDLFAPQGGYLLNLRRLSLIHCTNFSQQPRIKTPNLRFLKVVGDFSVASYFEVPILDNLSFISDIQILTRHSTKEEERVLKSLCDNPFGALKTRRLQLKVIALTWAIEFLKKIPGLECLTILEHPNRALSIDLFAALKEVEDVVQVDGPPQRKMVVCPNLQNLTVNIPSRRWPSISKWVAEVVTVRRNLGETFEGVALKYEHHSQEHGT
jgi:hypothetical protein